MHAAVAAAVVAAVAADMIYSGGSPYSIYCPLAADCFLADSVSSVCCYSDEREPDCRV